MARERGRRRGIRWLAGLLVILALLWCGYWYAASRAAEAGLGRFVAALAARGGSIACTDQGIGGFPLSLHLRCAGGKLANRPADLAAGISRVSARAPLYSPGRILADFVGPLVLNAPQAGVALTASWSIATANLDIGLNGLTRAGTSIDGLALDQTGALLPFARIAARHIDFVAAPGDGDDYRIRAAARDVAVARPDGSKYPVVGGRLDLTAINFGSGLGTNPRAAIAAWTRAGGKMRVDRLQLVAGGFTAAADGELDLDPRGLLSGTLTLSLTGLAELPDLVEQIRPGSRKRVARAVEAVAAMTQPVGNADTRKIPLFISKGVVSVMLIPIAVIPPVKL